MQEDGFEPRLGRIGARDGKTARRYQQRVLKSAALAGGRRFGGASPGSGFQGNRIGRGTGIGRVLASRGSHAAFRARRVVVKSRIVKLKWQGLKAARLHLRYIQRDGVTREGQPGELYDAGQDRAGGKEFLERCEGDRHQFRFIVSAEDSAQYEELKGFTRRFMARMEEDLGTRLDWVAVDHYNTGHPHTHIMLRGKDERGKDLVIARDYLSTGMRERAAEIATLDLGPKSDLEIETNLTREVEQERFTSIDRSLLKEADSEGCVRSGMTAGDAFRQSLRAGRLQKLKRLGLAEEVTPGTWKLNSGLEPALRRMGERGDIIKTLHRGMTKKGLGRAPSDYAIHDPVDGEARRIVGRVVARGLSDELNDRHYLIVDGLDGRAHYVDIGRSESVETHPEGAIVAITPKPVGPRAVDRTVAEVAAANGGRYDIEAHLRHDPTASRAFAETHVRRLEAMRRGAGLVDREPDGSWVIAPDHLERAASFERSQARSSPVIVETLSAWPLERQVTTNGETWLDRELVAERPEPLREAGFGGDVRGALALRRQWLVGQELAREEQDRIVYRANMLGILRRRELLRVAGQLSGELGLPYAETESGQKVTGTYRRHVDLASGRFAVIEKSREFTLVPWQQVLARHLGKQVSGIVREGRVSWAIGRQRGPGVS
ncbi:relaxase/mobilization nuclease RlxS [Parvibaculum sp.]|uniref:relaxase/mobilization nuclease RlxS n=1 Tax=Parvibaculum sp. TaxID=2024848 RepID=UPI002CE865F0|nr:relaxase/mobilization nuclease RlxS [Parvibaculum sp.]HUD53085.1 relaxase/mobilization nuclease RlxS [Parvibaculum sp.]